MKILTDLQEKVLHTFFAIPECRQHFYLTGGTALSAFYLHHRLSEDLDFFTHAVDIVSIERLVEDALKVAGFSLTKERGSPTFRRYTINGALQVDIVRETDFRVGSPELHRTFMVDHPKNIAVNKVAAIYGRLEPKDYVDLYCIQRKYQYDFSELFELAKEKDGGLEEFQWARIIMDVEAIAILPRMIIPLKLNDLKKFFHTLRNQLLDAIKPSR